MSADLLKQLAVLGLSIEQIGGVMEIIEALDKERNAKGNARNAAWRARLNLSPTEWRDRCHAVKQRDEFTCQYCGTEDGPMHVDHVIPLIQGGTSELDNLVTACRECNCGKSGRTPQQWRGDK